jgi:hypothetical protein
MHGRRNNHLPRNLRETLEPVVDLASGELVGWTLARRALAAADVGAAIRAARASLRDGQLLVVPLRAPLFEAPVAERMWGGESLRDLALVAPGSADRDALVVLERLRERGAQLGCETSLAVEEIAAIRPNFLWLGETAPRDARRSLAAGSVNRTLVALAEAIGGRVLADRRRLEGAAGASAAASEHASLAWFHDLAGLVEPLPSLPVSAPLSEVVDTCLSNDDQDWLVLVDEDLRPVRLLDRAAMVRQEPFEHPVCMIDATMSLDVATQRAVSRVPRERLRPLVLVAHDGRYQGILRIEAILDALATLPAAR